MLTKRANWQGTAIENPFRHRADTGVLDRLTIYDKRPRPNIEVERVA